MRRSLILVAAVGLARVAAGCSTDTNTDTNTDGTDAQTTLTVLGAASLTDAFPEIGDAFSAEHDGVELQFSFAGSQELVAQVDSGAPADTLALAGTGSLETLKAETGEPVVFAHNKLTIIVPTGNPANIDSIDDLADPDVKVALAGPEVPAGMYAAEAFDNAGITVDPVSEETDVKAVVTRVAVGGADAGVVYVTDAMAASDADIETVPIANKDNVIATYPAVSLSASEHADLSEEFVQYLVSDEAQAVLKSYGFGPA